MSRIRSATASCLAAWSCVLTRVSWPRNSLSFGWAGSVRSYHETNDSIALSTDGLDDTSTGIQLRNLGGRSSKPFAGLFSISPSLCLPSRRERAPRQSPEPIQPPSDDYINERDHQTAEDPTGVPSAS